MTDIDDVYDDFDFDTSELKAPTEAEIAFAEDVYKIFQDLIDSESGDVGEKPISRSNLQGSVLIISNQQYEIFINPLNL